MFLKISLSPFLLFTLSCLTINLSERFIFDNDKYTLMQYDFLYDEFNKIETDIYFYYNEKIDNLLYDENIILNDENFNRYQLCKSNVNRYSLELIKIDLMMKENEQIIKIESNNPNCYFFFNYDFVRIEKSSGNPRVSLFPAKPSNAYLEYTEPIASNVKYDEIKNYRLIMYLDKKMSNNIFISIKSNKEKTYKFLLKKEQLFNFD